MNEPAPPAKPVKGWSLQLKAWSGAHPGLVAAGLGAGTSLGYPPLGLWWLALPLLALAIVHLNAATGWRSALWRGWLFGWVHLTIANNWIATAFTHQAKMPEWLGWAAVPLLCIYLAVYPALAALAAYLGARRSGPLAFGALLASAWIVTEWVRSWAFTGYPWPPLGLMLLGGWESPGLARLLPFLGTYALSGLAVLLATILLLLVNARRWALSAGYALLVALVMLLPAAPQSHSSQIRYTLVQPLIPQDEINDGTKFEEQFQRIARLTLPGADTSRLVLWPESAIPDYLEEGYPERYYRRTTYAADPLLARQRIAAIIGEQSTLLTGVVNLNIGAREDGIPTAVSARNSVIAIGADGAIAHHYAKAHLVPYGEYLPLDDWLGVIGLERLTAGTIPYIPGPGPQTLNLGEHGRAGVQICYEIIFSGQVVDRDDRPDYIFNPSNDGWFGTWGPPQHLAQARLRAIEEGLPVLRSTTTGISAVINANGMVLQTIGSGEAGMVEGHIPAAHPPTLFARMGNSLPLVWAALLALIGAVLPQWLALRARRS